MKINAKYGFGMAPISAEMQGRYDYAVQNLQLFLQGATTWKELDADALSEFKGMINRCIRQDQWDWFSVHAKLGNPSPEAMRKAVNPIIQLRKCLLAADEQGIQAATVTLKKTQVATLLKAFSSNIEEFQRDGRGGWIYILSTREQPDILKIGMTTRSVFERVKEINSHTGVLIPFAARAIFRVEDARASEKRIFTLLASYRIRPDREFFKMPFSQAQSTIQEHLSEQSA